jgi:hypothetical protein
MFKPDGRLQKNSTTDLEESKILENQEWDGISNLCDVGKGWEGLKISTKNKNETSPIYKR